MALPESFLTELRYKSDIEEVVSSYVSLKRAGRNLKGLCPFHSEKSPSFTVYPETMSYYCFGCGAGGDVVTFVKNIENLDYIESLKFLAARAGMPFPEQEGGDYAGVLRRRVLELNKTAARFFHDTLRSPGGAAGMSYLKNRGVSSKMIVRYGLGYAPPEWDALSKHLTAAGFTKEEMIAAAVLSVKDKRTYDSFRERIMFPIIDLRGNVIAFGGRAVGEARGPKYLNSADTPVFKKSRNLFSLNFAKGTKDRTLILCEGYMDVISVHQAGFENAVATLGTAITAEQSRLIASYADTVIIAYDSDSAGSAATGRAVNLLEQVGVKTKILNLENAKDPDEYITKFGALRFKMLLEGSVGATEYEIAKLKEKYDLTFESGKLGFLTEFSAFAAGINNPVERDVYTSKCAAETGVSKSALESRIQSLRKRAAREKDKKAPPAAVYSRDDKAVSGDRARTRNLKWALLEERIILILYKNPDYFDKLSQKISPNMFATDINRKIYEIISYRITQGLQIDFASLASVLEEKEIARMAYIAANDTGVAFDEKDILKYADDLAEYQTQTLVPPVADMNNDELLKYIEHISKNKK